MRPSIVISLLVAGTPGIMIVATAEAALLSASTMVIVLFVMQQRAFSRIVSEQRSRTLVELQSELSVLYDSRANLTAEESAHFDSLLALHDRVAKTGERAFNLVDALRFFAPLLLPLPLLLFLHGGGSSSRFLASLQGVFASQWATQAIPELVVVTPSAGRSFYVDYRDGSQLWETFLRDELLPLVRERFNVGSEPAKTLVSGVSMGGMGSLRLAFKYPEAFGAVAALEPGIEPAL